MKKRFLASLLLKRKCFNAKRIEWLKDKMLRYAGIPRQLLPEGLRKKVYYNCLVKIQIAENIVRKVFQSLLKPKKVNDFKV